MVCSFCCNCSGRCIGSEFRGGETLEADVNYPGAVITSAVKQFTASGDRLPRLLRFARNDGQIVIEDANEPPKYRGGEILKKGYRPIASKSRDEGKFDNEQW